MALVALITSVLAALGALVGPGGIAAAQDRALVVERLDTEAELRTDGSMLITEQITYRYEGGPFTVGIRSFEQDLDAISALGVSDDEGPLQVTAPDDSESGQWEWTLRAPRTDETETYTLTYFVAPQVQLGRDVSLLEWQFLGTEHDGVGIVNIRLRFPLTVPPANAATLDDDANVMRAWVRSPADGILRLAPSEVIVQARNVSAGQFIDVHALAPANTFNTKGTAVLLPGILAEERQYVAGPTDDSGDRRNGWLLSSLIAAIGAVGAGVLWVIGGREASSTAVQGDYWREPLDDPPAVALANLQRGKVDAGHALAGTIVDLAQRGHLRIVGEREERLGPDRTVHRYTRLETPNGAPLLDYERDVLELVFRGATESSSEELRDWATEHQSDAKRRLDSITSGVKAEYARRGYGEESNRRLVGALVAICVAVGGMTIAATAITGYGFGLWGLAIAAGLFGLGVMVLSNRNQASVEAAAKAEGLKRYLKDFSRLEDAPVGHLILWERYLVAAVALGVSADLVRGLSSRLPQLLADPAFGSWYVAGPGAVGRFSGFDAIETTSGSSFVSASTPNSTGSGGGFSSGPATGGGGGGFGAR